MATTAELRSQIASLTRLAQNDLAALWRRIERAVEANEPLNDILPALIETYGAAAATVSANWYDELRDKQGIAKRFAAIPAIVPPAGAPALIGYAQATATDVASFQSLIEGGVQRRIANVSRQTVVLSSLEDPESDGWQRVGSGECSFCALLIGRGQVYSSKTADFASHDHCGCSAIPAFGGQPRPVKPYTPTRRNISDADRARVREYLRNN